MAQAPNPYGDLGDLMQFGGGQDPTITPSWLQLPAAPEATPMPYSPEGWQASKFAPAPQAEAEPAPVPSDPKAAKKPAIGFTPEQALALQKMTAVEQPKVQGGHGGGGAAPRGQVAPMQQLNAGGQASAQRASLGQIIYGGRKF